MYQEDERNLKLGAKLYFRRELENIISNQHNTSSILHHEITQAYV